MVEQERKYTLVVQKKRIDVSREVYKAYYQCRDREKYLEKLAETNSISFEECEEKGIPVDFQLSRTNEFVDEYIIKREMLKKMMSCIDMLSEQERILIYELFFKGKSERRLSTETSIPLMTINDRKRRVLKKLKKLLDK